jgi:superfamily II RNA helicase
MNQQNIDWYSSLKFKYENLTKLYAGLGTVVIDGDSLINYLNLDNSNDSHRLDDFVNKFTNSNLECKFIFFHSISNWTVIDGVKLALNENFKRIFSNYAGKVNIFSDWSLENNEWHQFKLSNNINLVLISDSDIFSQQNIQFHYIRRIYSTFRLQVAILDHLKFIQLKAYSFILTDMTSMLANNNVDLKNYQSINDSEELTLSSNDLNLNFDNYCFDVADLNEIYQNEAGSVCSFESDQQLLLDDTKTWFEDKKVDNNKQTNKGKQKYYRHLERLSKSLDASKHLHHKIVISTSSDTPTNGKNKKKEQQKVSKKEQDILNMNKVRIEKEKMDKEMNIFKQIQSRITQFEDIEDKELLKISNYKEFGHKFHFEILKLKIKWLNFKSSDCSSLKRSQIFVLIIEMFENSEFMRDLSCKEILEYLKLMEKNGFPFVANDLKSKLLNLDEFGNDSQTQRRLLSNFEPIIGNDHSLNDELLFQLQYLGDYMKRSLNSQDDPRVRFKPDKWQQDLLDIIDRRESALVSCPTSSGKTFISYYVMEQALKSNNNNDMAVFVSPNKALINQVSAEIYTRFGNNSSSDSTIKSLFSIQMNDFATNSYDSCKILITTAPVLESLLSESVSLKFKNQIDWRKNIKYIILDEIQTLNDTDLGRSLEKVIHFCECPILALSATIGNLDSFYDWFEQVHIAKGIKTNKIVNTERFCELRKYLFTPNEPLVPVHELFGYSVDHLLTNRFSSEFHLFPFELYQLINGLNKITKDNAEQARLIDSIKPENFFKNNKIIKKSDVKEYEIYLLNNLKQWVQSGQFKPNDITGLFNYLNQDCNQAFAVMNNGDRFGRNWCIDNVYELVCNLRDNQMLPAIVFLKSNEMCDQLATKLVTIFEEQETIENQKKNEKITKDDLKKSKLLKKSMNNKKKNSTKDWQLECEVNEEANQLEDSQNLDKIDDEFTFIDLKYKIPTAEVDELTFDLRNRKITPSIINGLKRGIGVHHANYHTKFRQTVEYLFRRRHLQIVFATETLALGINMPCKTVVLPSDAMTFDSINYRHMIGRAGRRGFDLFGNIVYYGLTEQKIKNFISSNIAHVRGSFSLDLDLILQVSVMNSFKLNGMTILKSFIKNPLTKLTLDEYRDETTCIDLTKNQIIYLMNKSLIDSQFRVDINVNQILPLRNENKYIFIIYEVVNSSSFKTICQSINLNLEDAIAMILCHFVSIRFILPKQSSLLRSNEKMKVLILKRIPLLDKLLQIKQTQLDNYINSFNDHRLKEGFPQYLSVMKHDKESFLFNFYMIGLKDEIIKSHSINETALWYAMKEFKMIIDNISKHHKTTDSQLKQAFQQCAIKVNQRFDLIKN